MINILIIILLLSVLFYLFNKIFKENFIVKKQFPVAVTWTPYITDFYNQPGYSNYFYNNGYMYPIY